MVTLSSTAPRIPTQHSTHPATGTVRSPTASALPVMPAHTSWNSIFGTETAAPAVTAPTHGNTAGLFDSKRYIPGAPVEIKTRRIFSPDTYGRMSERTTREKQSFRGTLQGHDQYGRAVVRLEDGVSEARVHFEAVAPRIPEGVNAATVRARAADPETLFEGIAPENMRAAPPRVLEALHSVLDEPVVGTHTAREYIDAMEADGHRVFLVGGAIRDALRALKTEPGVSDAALRALFADVDLVTTAMPEDVRAISARLAPELGAAAIWTPPSINRFGVVGIGERHSGLDVASFRVGFSDRNGSIFGKRIVDDALGRDFSVNQLYLDFATGQIIDPTGHGVADSEGQVLRPNPHDPEHNQMLALRWLKFRNRGFLAAPGGAATIAAHARAGLPVMARASGAAGIINNLMKVVPSGMENPQAASAYYARLGDIAAEDGMTDVFDQHLAPTQAAVTAEARRRAGVA